VLGSGMFWRFVDLGEWMEHITNEDFHILDTAIYEASLNELASYVRDDICLQNLNLYT
jgi:hypothetical protein